MWLVVVVILVGLLYLGMRKPRGYPPGPPRLPLLGFLPFLDSHLPHKQMWRLSDTYGPVVGLYFGTQPAVVVNGWEAVKEALQNDDLNGRPENVATVIQYGFQGGVMFSEGELWKEQRRFALHQFRNLGFGKKSHEAIVHDEVRELLKEIGSAKGSISLPGMLGVSAINILWAILGGNRFERSDGRLWDLVERLNIVFRAGEISGGIVQSFPFLRHVFPKSHSFNTVLDGLFQVDNFIKANYPKDFIDIYLNEMEKQKDDSSTTFTEKQLLATCTDIFNAGTETGSATLSFGILLLTLNPEVMRKVQAELDEVVGRSRMPSLEDRTKLAYSDATLSEVLRIRSAAPITVPHKATKDTTVQGCRIPADTMMLVNLYSVVMDPEYWQDPETFRPERFLNPDGTARKDERLIVFGKGRRACLGEALARMTSFVLFTTLLQNFDFSLDPAVPVPNTEGKSGFTLGPPEFRVFAKPRS
ncbi:Methyl farnesoate epoxidase [Chionoecetes opilio]|uniref:Methyl farnesoate epoxidase n=1 Tax=Chionoecetes opilio TaxID=41210 RepID=A0A8J4XR76_CHIOP|nr:Methyl farnesoate epoxidase [Chionoecetes opilio]